MVETLADSDHSASGNWPRQFGKYELIRKIGSGGMAEVFLARSFGAEGLEKQLVIKRILPEYARKERFVSMFIDEAKLAVSLNHPNIVQTYDFGRVGDDYYLAMEYVEGTDLARLMSRLRRLGPLPLGESIYVAIELCKGLDYAHRRTDKYGEPLNLVHRDISPQNLLISREGNLKIVDFGIAHARNVGAGEPAGLIKGKYSYMSPEQAHGLPVDQRSDVFSAGAVLFEMVYGRPLFRFTTSEETLDLVRRAVVPDLHGLNPDVPGSVERVIYRALEAKLEARYPSARDMQVDLHRVMLELGEIHDAHSVASFLERQIELSDIAAAHRVDEVQTVVHAQREKTPSVLSPSGSLVGTASSTSVLAGVEATPATPVLRPGLGGLSTSGDLRHTKKDVICVAGSIRGLGALPGAAPAVGGERRQGLLMELMRIVEAIAFKNRAIVEHFSESGFVLLLGLPVSSENDAERAVWMAYDLLEAVEGINLNLETPLEISLGLALGRALLQRASGGTYERTLLGQVTELAQRMAEEARSSEIVVGGRIYQRTRRSFELAYLRQIPFEEDARYGWSNPSVYRLLRPKSRKERQAELRESFGQLYGRELALKAVRERFHRVQVEGSCLGFAFEGETGFGKSAVADEFLRGLEGLRRHDLTTGSGLAAATATPAPCDAASAPPAPPARDEEAWTPAFTILRSMATQHEGDTPYAILRELVADLLDVDIEAAPRTLRARIEAVVEEAFGARLEPGERAYLISSLGFFFELRDADSPIEALTGSRRRSRLFLSVQRLIEQRAHVRPVVVVVEDLHHCDSSSLEFLGSLIHGRPRCPIFLVMTFRPITEPSVALERLVFNPHVHIEQLDELSRRDATALVRERLGDAEIDRVALDYILDRAGGVPHYLCELVDALRARKVLRLVNGRFTLGGSAHETWLPTSLEAVVAARIDQLEPELKSTLRSCSVLGPEFERRDAIFLLGEEVVAQLGRLAQLDWLKRTRSRSGDGGGGYRFTHTLTYEVAFRELLWEERKEQHARLADHLQSEARAGRRQPDLATVARHLEGAQRHDEAASFYLLAASRALAASSHVESLRMINRALELARPDERVVYDALSIKETVLSALSHHEERLECLQGMQRHAEAHLGESEQLTVLNRLAQYWLDQRQFERATEQLEQVFARSDESHHLAQLSLARKHAATLRREAGNANQAIELLGQAMMGFVAEDDHRMAARTSKAIGDTYWQMGRYKDALEAYEETLLQATGDEDRDLREVTTINQALVRVSQGDYEPALEHYVDALRSCRSIGFQRREAAILPNLGHLYMLLGQGSRAERTLHRALRLARLIRDQTVLCDAILTLGVLHLDRDRFDKADELLRRGRRLAVETEINYLHIHAQLALARLRLRCSQRTDDAEAAARFARDAMQRGEAAAMIHGVAHGEHLLSLALERLGQDDEAMACSARALDTIARRNGVQGHETILYEQGLMLERLDPQHPERGRRLLEDAARTVESIAARLHDEERRRRFLARACNARILQDWLARAGARAARVIRGA